MKLAIPEQVLHQHGVVLGKTGSGKSSKLRYLVEYLLDHNKRVCVIDIKGDWWGLKIGADGKSQGYPVIAFGNFREPKATDVPLNRHAGAEIAELIATGNRPCLIGFSGWMPAEITEFWIGNEANDWNGFAPTLYRKNVGELYLVISECHNFAPKGRVLDPKAGRVLHWTNRLMSEGRGLGMSIFLDSQRPQKVHNDTLDSCETLIGARMTHPAAREAVKEWIEGCGDPARGKEVLAGLASLKREEAFVWSPEIGFGPERVTFPMFRTFDSFAPAQAQRQVLKSGWSTVNLEDVKQKLSSLIEEAKENDPTELKKKIRELAKRIEEVGSSPMPHAVSVEAVADAVKKRDAEWTESVRVFRDRVEELLKNARLSCGAIVEMCGKEIDSLVQPCFVYPSAATVNVRQLKEMEREILRPDTSKQVVLEQSRTASVIAGNNSGESGLRKSAIRALQILAGWPKGLTEGMLGAQLGLKTYGGGWNTLRRSILDPGYAVIEGDRYKVTDAGMKSIGASYPKPPENTLEVLNNWEGKLRESSMRAVRKLVEIHPYGITREKLGEALGLQPRGGGWNYLMREIQDSGLAVASGSQIFAHKENLLL